MTSAERVVDMAGESLFSGGTENREIMEAKKVRAEKGGAAGKPAAQPAARQQPKTEAKAPKKKDEPLAAPYSHVRAGHTQCPTCSDRSVGVTVATISAYCGGCKLWYDYDVVHKKLVMRQQPKTEEGEEGGDKCES